MNGPLAQQVEQQAKPIMGYSDRLTVRPGEAINFNISTASDADYQAQLVQVINGDTVSSEAHYKEREIESPINGIYTGTHQAIGIGSYGIITDTALLDQSQAFTLMITFQATLQQLDDQVLISRWNSVASQGWRLLINGQGQLVFETTTSARQPSRLSCQPPVALDCWYRATVRVRYQEGVVELQRDTLKPMTGFQWQAESIVVSDKLPLDYQLMGSPLLIAASAHYADEGKLIPQNLFNGRIEAPKIFQGCLTAEQQLAVAPGVPSPDLALSLLACWDFSQGIETFKIIDTSPNRLHGQLVNMPLRAVRGSQWDGSVMDWRLNPSHYGAIHFHADDLYDCCWQTSLNYQVDRELASGVYALRVRLIEDGEEDYLPFFVAPAKAKPTSTRALLLPTHTYMAYGNIRSMEKWRREAGQSKAEFYNSEQSIFGDGFEQYCVAIDANPALGSSLYDRHSDGSPVHISSWLRPLLSMRPKTLLWTLGADLLIVDWLSQGQLDCDIITDDLLQEEGTALLQQYNTVITGNHPEYITSENYQALHSYLSRGGRLIYLGGNGFHWRCAAHSSETGVLELRRGRRESEPWCSAVGESYMAFNGEQGGLWRENGKPPQALVGSGYIGQGGRAGSSYFRICPAAREGITGFILDGVEDDVIGDFGILGQAAGQEIDQANTFYGTPGHAVVIARSENHSPTMENAEHLYEQAYNFACDPAQREQTYADIVFFETAHGGAVFAVGSMAWCGCLSHNDYNNAIARITGNVLRRFDNPQPFDRYSCCPQINNFKVGVFSGSRVI